MRYVMPFAISMIALFLILNSLIVIGQVEPWSYEDETGDVMFISQSTGYEDDIDLIGMTCDASGDPIVLTITVSGNIIPEYGPSGSNNYVLGLDLDGDEDSAEIGVQFTGIQADEEDFVIINTPTTIEFLTTEEYEIIGSTITVRIDREYMGDHEEVLDFTASTIQIMNAGTGTDSIHFEFGEDDEPYDDGSTDDDDTVDDDTSDDDITDNDEDERTPGFIFHMILISIIIACLIIRSSRKR